MYENGKLKYTKIIVDNNSHRIAEFNDKGKLIYYGGYEFKNREFKRHGNGCLYRTIPSHLSDKFPSKLIASFKGEWENGLIQKGDMFDMESKPIGKVNG